MIILDVGGNLTPSYALSAAGMSTFAFAVPRCVVWLISAVVRASASRIAWDAPFEPTVAVSIGESLRCSLTWVHRVGRISDHSQMPKAPLRNRIYICQRP